MEMIYSKAVIRYDHVGHSNEVSIARHLVFPKGSSIYEVITEIHSMPGTKDNCIQSVYKILKKNITEEK